MEDYYLYSRGEALSAILPLGKKEARNPDFSFDTDAEEFVPKTLSQEQSDAVNAILADKERPMHYLYGTTEIGRAHV